MLLLTNSTYVAMTRQSMNACPWSPAGAVLSLALFKRRQWPLVFGVGAGAGVGYANCQNEVRDSFRESAKEK